MTDLRAWVAGDTAIVSLESQMHQPIEAFRRAAAIISEHPRWVLVTGDDGLLWCYLPERASWYAVTEEMVERSPCQVTVQADGIWFVPDAEYDADDFTTDLDDFPLPIEHAGSGIAHVSFDAAHEALRLVASWCEERVAKQ